MLKHLSNALVAILLCFPIRLAAAGDLPPCLTTNHGETAQKIMKQNDVSPKDLLARLVYAEASSTGFADNPLIYQAIAWGVLNRVRLADISKSMRKTFGEGIYGVIFQRGQFNPALSTKSQFHIKFICPNEATRWRMAKSAADAALEGKNNPFIQTAWEKRHNLSLVVNFYYPKSIQARGPLAPWEGNRSLRFIGDVSMGETSLLSSHIRFYRMTRPPADVD